MTYFDTSALAKKYLRKEKGRHAVLRLLEANPEYLITSALTQLEMVSALTRRQKEITGYEKALRAFRTDWEAFIVWSVDNEVIASADELIRKHRLKSADAVHLATALNVKLATRESVLLVSSDQELLSAGNKEGLLVSDPETE